MIEEDRLGPPPIEPLSEAAWSRVERGVWSQLDAAAAPPRVAPRPRRWWLVAAPLAAAAIVAIVIRLGAPTTEVASEPSRVVSGASPSLVSFGDAHIELAADTALALSHETGHPVVLLERGAAWFTVAPRAARPAFVVRAGDATVHVIGTRFHVARAHERITVEVEHGLVDVQFRGNAVALHAAERWSSDPPAPPAPAPVPAPAPLRAPVPAAPPPVDHLAPRPRRSAEPIEAAPVDRDRVDRDRVDRDRVEYDRLATVEAASPDAALAGYLALARRSDRWADPALFAAARLAVDRRDRRARTLLELYLQRFPSGANATDARQLLARVRAP